MNMSVEMRQTLLFFLVFWPVFGAFVSWLADMVSAKLRDNAVTAVVAVEFAVMVGMLTGFFQDGTVVTGSMAGFGGWGLNLEMDGFRAVYGTVASLMWLGTGLFGREYFASHYKSLGRYNFFYLFTLGATMGVFLGADLFTVFIFFEIMSFTSYTWVVHDETPEAMRAGQTYLAVAIFGGMAMLFGLAMLYTTAGTLTLSELYTAVSEVPEKGKIWAAGLLILTGFGAKAGMFPLHIWLPKAHPVAPAPASALLSGILTKSGIFGVIAVTVNVFRHDPAWGNMLLVLGAITMFGGALLALFSVNFKRTLACSSMSQIGFILIGIGLVAALGEENMLAARGTLLHMMNHWLFMLLLFMVAGVIYMNTHKLNLNELKGWGRGKPLLMVLYLSGALGIGGIPLFSGYISKTLLHEGIVEYAEMAAEAGGAAGWITVLEWVFLLTGGMTLAYMGKLFTVLFIDRPQKVHLTAKEKKRLEKGIRKSYMSPLSVVTLSVVALIIPVFGILPGLTMNQLADLTAPFFGAESAGDIAYFSLTNLKGSLISILFGVVIYLAVMRLLARKTADGQREYLDCWPVWLDLENSVYRVLLEKVLLPLLGAVCGFCDGLADKGIGVMNRVFFREKSEDYWMEKGMTAEKLRKRLRIRQEQILTSSLSFGLLLCAAGMVATLLYLLYWR